MITFDTLSERIDELRKIAKRRMLRSFAIGFSVSYVTELVIYLTVGLNLYGIIWAIIKGLLIVAALIWRSRI